MSEAAPLPWRSVPRAATAYGERAAADESKVDRFLLAAGAGLKRPFSRALRRAAAVAERVAREQAEVQRMSDAELRAAALELRRVLLQRGLVAEPVARSFALVRAAAERVLGMTHFPVQLMGGHVMLEGMLAEMGTGEGKTLTATLPAATVALAGMPVHIVTVNDYLAERDAAQMRPVYAALGLTTGVTQHGQSPEERRASYAADICYCTNKDLGFDYLRDTLTLASHRGRGRLMLQKLFGQGDRLDRLLLRGLHFAIVDEADSVLIDEARTPLIIAAAGDSDADQALFEGALAIASQLERDIDFRLDLGERVARLTEVGRARLKAAAQTLPPAWRSARGREELAQQGLAALYLFDRDAHYLVRDDKVQIIDEYTGRILADRSWERGLQQLIEIKEGCEVTARRHTLARITYQRLFRRFLRLSGMTGTAIEVAAELETVYGLRAVRIPPNRPLRRRNLGLRCYRERTQKWYAVVDAVSAQQRAGRPVLVGTRSVAASEELAALLAARGVEHVVLNARQDSEEAGIIAQAGQAQRVTVATNMAGRGTDIILAREIAARGGLHVVLTEFHESKRIDRQLFGRSGRQGDPGTFEAIVCLEDEIFRRYAGRLVQLLAARFGVRQAPLPKIAALALRGVAQQAAEWSNSHVRRLTLEQDKRLEAALAFAGRSE